MQLLTRVAGAGAVLACAVSLAGCSSAGIEEPTFTATPISTSPPATSSPSAASAVTVASTSNSAPNCTKQVLIDSGIASHFEMGACEGGFASISQPQTDNIGIVQWRGGKWEQVAQDSEYTSGSSSGCYSRGLLDDLGVPESVRVAVCDSVATPAQAAGSDYFLQNGIIVAAGLGEAGEKASYPTCDGRAVLILDSVIDHGNDGGAMHEIAQQVLTVHPSGNPVRFTVPGACPSLRAQVDGQNVYPVYIDYGGDVDAMCRAKATYGGNGRILSNAAEYVDPC